LYYSKEELEGIINDLDTNHKLYHNRRHSLPIIITKDYNSDNKLIFTVMVPKNNKKNESASKGSKKEASGSREGKKESSPSAAHPTEGTTKQVVEAPKVASGANPEVVESAVPSSSGQSETTETKVMVKLNDNLPIQNKPTTNILLPHEEDIEMKEETNSISSLSMEDVEEYWKKIPDEIPSLESAIKNPFGGSGPINTFNPNNPGITFLLANDKMFKDLKNENTILKQQLVLQQNNMQSQINMLMKQIAQLTTNASQTIELDK